MLRESLAIIALLAVPVVACKFFTPEDAATVADTQATIDRCEAIGRACKDAGQADCLAQYYACMQDAGLE